MLRDCFSLLSILLLGTCGSEEGGYQGVAQMDGGGQASDAGSSLSDASAGGPCGLTETPLPKPDRISGFYGPFEGPGSEGPGGPTTIYLSGGVDDDLFLMTLTDGVGVFEAGLRAGTYDVAGRPANPNDCGLCIRVLADVNMQTEEATMTFAALSGSVRIGAVEEELGGRLEGSIENLVVREIDTSSGESLEIDNGCVLNVDLVDFDLRLQEPPSGGT